MPGVAPGDGLVGDPEHGGDPAERRPPVELKRMDQPVVEVVETGGAAEGRTGAAPRSAAPGFASDFTVRG
ncbi:hypothetical protein [Streptomyces sp. RPA4-5]|uniref:hypothetical protein n=1 Tax=Streptomyces sp. RPA4-5 TaxID=2721245 RepID=UPI002001DB76|nr:hypothetical protein [Streptomyces sp. RPA4-5]